MKSFPMANRRRAAIGAAVFCSTFVLLGAGRAAAEDAFSFGGKVFADVTYRTNKDEGTNVKSTDTGFGTDVKRFYLQFGYKVDDVWSATFVSDIGDKGSKRYDIFVKKAYIEAKLSPAAIFRVGSADLPWVPYVEDLYGYRYVENVLIDRVGFGTSADWGIHFKGANGIVNYAAGVVNGHGYSDPSRSGSVDVAARVGFAPIEGLDVGIGAYSGKLGQDTDANPAQHTATRYDAVANYRTSGFDVGGEYFRADDWKNVTKTATDSADGLSVWVSVPVSSVELFARYDTDKPSKDLNPDLKDTYYNAGVQIHPLKPLLVAFAYKHQTVDAGLGGSVGGVGSSVPGAKGSFDELGVWAQLKW